MKAYEAAKLKKMTNKEFLAEYGLKSHMSKISPELEAELFGEEKKIQTEPEPAPTVDSTEADLVTGGSDEGELVSVQCNMEIDTDFSIQDDLGDGLVSGDVVAGDDEHTGSNKAKEIAVEPTSDAQSTECPYTKEQIELGIRCLGNKSPVWEWRHILNG